MFTKCFLSPYILQRNTLRICSRTPSWTSGLQHHKSTLTIMIEKKTS
ncbi:hypothetical protein HanPSC8_Chr08g0328611 [Helianthus annuus]|nr:hypothetical protein HanPSC8_Chr08g0328611 [Helianthus annuus]